jgi:hypothetical protein
MSSSRLNLGWGPLWGAGGAAAGAVIASLPGIAGGWLQSLVMGLGVGAALGAALAAFNVRELFGKTRFWRALATGVVVGLAGGGFGASVGHMLYAVSAAASGQTNASGLFSSDMRERLTQAGAKAGEIEIGLLWENTNDLDLYVVDPVGAIIFFGTRRSASGGELDIDRNAGCQRDLTSKPVEHVVWPAGRVPHGEFKILVHEYSNCGHPDPTPFRVELVAAGRQQTFTGMARRGEPPQLVHSFRYPTPASLGPLVGTLIGWLARIIGWTLFGTVVGSAQGAVRRSLEALRNGALGGFIGGAAGGLAFVAVAGMAAAVLANSTVGDWCGRVLGCAILGACIGLGIAIVERVLSSVMTIRSGRYEGRDIVLDRPVIRIGRNEILELYLGGDTSIASHHATIERQGREFAIVAVGGPVIVNGQPVARHTLATDDLVTLGATRMVFRGKRPPGSGPANPRGSSVAPLPPAPPPARPSTPPSTPPPPPAAPPIRPATPLPDRPFVPPAASPPMSPPMSLPMSPPTAPAMSPQARPDASPPTSPAISPPAPARPFAPPTVGPAASPPAQPSSSPPVGPSTTGPMRNIPPPPPRPPRPGNPAR